MAEKNIQNLGENKFLLVTTSIVILGLFLGIWEFFIAARITKIPDDFSYSADVISIDNPYNEKEAAYTGERYSKTIFSYSVVGKKGDVLNIKNIFNVQSLEGKQIYKVEPIYGINALTGEHVNGYGDHDRYGYLFAPRWLKKGESFTYWHASNNIPAKMSFVSEENLYGLKVYKYETDYGGPVDQTKVLDFLSGVPEERGVKLESKNYLWVEPISGYLVKQEDFSTDYYYYDIKTGKKISPYNKFINTYSEDSIRKHVEIAKDRKNIIYLVFLVVPVFFLFCFFTLIPLLLWRRSRLMNFLGTNGVAVLFAFLTMLFTIFLYNNVEINIQQRRDYVFAEDSTQFVDTLLKRFDLYSHALLGARAFFDVKGNVTRSDWEKYVGSVNINKHYPGMDLFAYAKAVSGGEKDEFVKSVRENDLSDFKIWPEGDRDKYFVVYYSEPFNERSQKAVGYDMRTDEVRKKALDQAMRFGDVTMTNKLTLISDRDILGSDIGFLVFAPVYKGGVIPKTLSEKESLIDGFISTPLHISDIVEGILEPKKNELGVNIYDGLSVLPDSLMYGTEGQNQASRKNILYRSVQTVYLANHPWTIEFFNASGFRQNFVDRYLPLIILLSGTAFSGLLYIILYFIFSAKKRAVLVAKKLTSDLEDNKKELEEKNKSLEEKVSELNSMNKAMIDRELKMIELKKKIDKE